MALSYKECEYINIQGYNAYFDTGHKITQNTRCVAQFMTLNGAGSYAWGSWLGNANDDTDNSWRIRWGGSSSVFSVGMLGSGVNSSTKSANKVYNVEFGNLYFKDLDSGEEVTGTSVTFEDRTYNFLIGNNINKSSYHTNANYYSVKLYEGDTLIGDYVPCLDSSSKVAFYDKVTDSFIYSNGGGSITYKLKPVTKKYDFLGDSVVLLPSHEIDAQPYVDLQNLRDKYIPFVFNTATTTDVHIKAKMKFYQDGGNGLQLQNNGDNSDWRLFAYSSSYAYWDLGSQRYSFTDEGFRYTTTNPVEFIIGNNYLLHADGSSWWSATYQTPTMYKITDGYCNLIVGKARYFYIQVLDDNDNLLLDLIPKKDSDGNICLYDKLTDTYYGADWGMTYGEQGTTVNNWKSVSSIDFGGTNVTFSGTMANWSANTNISAVTNGSILNTDGRSLFKSDTALTTFDCELPNLTQGGDSSENGMFEFASKLTSFTPTQMPKLVDSTRMFQGCSGLISFTTDCPSLLTATSMFYSCGNLKDVSANFSALTSGQTMFATDTKLTSFTSNLSSLQTANWMFSGDTALTTASLGETTKLNYNTNMFLNCNNLTACSMSLSSITGWNGMFSGCNNLVDWHIKDLGIECSTLLKTGVTSFDYIADNAKSVTNGEWFVMTDDQYDTYSDAVATLQGKGWTVYKESNYPQERTEGTNQVLMSNGSFSLCGKTYSNNLECVNKWVTLPDSANTWTSMANVMNGNTVIKKIYCDLGSCTNASAMCKSCYSLTDFSGDLSSLQVAGSYYPEYGTFIKCSALTSFTTTNLDNLVSGISMFRGCGLTSFTYDMPNMNNGEWMFTDNGGGFDAKLTSFISDMHSLERGGRMFYNCNKLSLFRTSLLNLKEQYSCLCGVNGNMFYQNTALTDFQVWQLPISSSLTLPVDYSPINYNSFVYMALNNAEVSAISEDQHLSGCTLKLSTTSKNLSASTDVTKYWNLLEKKGYKIYGYTADITDLPTFVEVRDNDTTFEGDGSSDSGSPLVVALTHSLSSTTITGSVSNGYIQLNNYTNNLIDVVIGSQTYQILANTNSSVIEIKSGKQLTFTSDSEVSYTKVDDTDNNTTTITF